MKTEISIAKKKVLVPKFKALFHVRKFLQEYERIFMKMFPKYLIVLKAIYIKTYSKIGEYNFHKKLFILK